MSWSKWQLERYIQFNWNMEILPCNSLNIVFYLQSNHAQHIASFFEKLASIISRRRSKQGEQPQNGRTGVGPGDEVE